MSAPSSYVPIGHQSVYYTKQLHLMFTSLVNSETLYLAVNINIIHYDGHRHHELLYDRVAKIQYLWWLS